MTVPFQGRPGNAGRHLLKVTTEGMTSSQGAGVRGATEHPTRWFLTSKNYLVQNVEMRVRKPKENVEGMIVQLNQNSSISVFIQGASV